MIYHLFFTTKSKAQVLHRELQREGSKDAERALQLVIAKGRLLTEGLGISGDGEIGSTWPEGAGGE